MPTTAPVTFSGTMMCPAAPSVRPSVMVMSFVPPSSAIAPEAAAQTTLVGSSSFTATVAAFAVGAATV